MAPEVSEAVQRAKDLKDLKDNNYRVIAAIREQIRCSCAIATPEEPGTRRIILRSPEPRSAAGFLPITPLRPARF